MKSVLLIFSDRRNDNVYISWRNIGTLVMNIVDIWQALATDVYYESQYWFCWKLMSKHRLVILNIQQYNASRCNLRVLTARKRLHKSLNAYVKLNFHVKYRQSLFNIHLTIRRSPMLVLFITTMKNKIEIFITICSRIFYSYCCNCRDRKKEFYLL